MNPMKRRMPVRTGPSAQYGEATRLRAAQKVVPMGAAPTEVMPSTRPKVAVTPLSAPTQFPKEPITTGIDMGPGLGSLASGILPMMSQEDIAIQELRAIAMLEDNDDLNDLLDRYGMPQ